MACLSLPTSRRPRCPRAWSRTWLLSLRKLKEVLEFSARQAVEEVASRSVRLAGEVSVFDQRSLASFLAVDGVPVGQARRRGTAGAAFEGVGLAWGRGCGIEPFGAKALQIRAQSLRRDDGRCISRDERAHFFLASTIVIARTWECSIIRSITTLL